MQPPPHVLRDIASRATLMIQMPLAHMPRILWLPIFSLLAGGIGIGMLLGIFISSGPSVAVAIILVGVASAFWAGRAWHRAFQSIDAATAAVLGISSGN